MPSPSRPPGTATPTVWVANKRRPVHGVDDAHLAARQSESAGPMRSAADIFGNPFRPVVIDPAWRTAAVVALAKEIYENRAFDLMTGLAAALEGSGCHGVEILSHCRADRARKGLLGHRCDPRERRTSRSPSRRSPRRQPARGADAGAGRCRDHSTPGAFESGPCTSIRDPGSIDRRRPRRSPGQLARSPGLLRSTISAPTGSEPCLGIDPVVLQPVLAGSDAWSDVLTGETSSGSA